jgi:hypothetical protein
MSLSSPRQVCSPRAVSQSDTFPCSTALCEVLPCRNQSCLSRQSPKAVVVVAEVAALGEKMKEEPAAVQRHFLPSDWAYRLCNLPAKMPQEWR